MVTVLFDNIPEGDPACTVGDITRSCIEDVASWKTIDLGNPTYNESKVYNITERLHEYVVRINNDEKYELSQNEQILVKRDGKYILPETIDLKIGDEIVSYNNNSIELIFIENIETVPKESKVFLIYREPWGLLVAESMLAYNGCNVNQTPLTN